MLQRATVRCHSVYPITPVWRSVCHRTPHCSDRGQTGPFTWNRSSFPRAGRFPRGLPIHFRKSCWTQSRHPDNVGLTSLLRVSLASFYEHRICARWECLPRVISHTTWKIHELLYVCSYQLGLCLIFPFPQVASTRGSLQKVSPAVVPAVFCP